MAAGKQYRYVGNHATELQVGDARPWVGEGEFITLSDEDVNNEDTKQLIDTGVLVDVEQQTKAAEAEAKAAEAEAATAQEGTETAAATTTEDKKGGK